MHFDVLITLYCSWYMKIEYLFIKSYVEKITLFLYINRRHIFIIKLKHQFTQFGNPVTKIFKFIGKNTEKISLKFLKK
jgi:hypothetical protein